MNRYDNETLQAAHAAALVFQANGWEYEKGEKRYKPSVVKLADTIQRLIDALRAKTPEPDADGFWSCVTATGRFEVLREVQQYTHEIADDLTISLNLASIDDSGRHVAAPGS